MSVAIPGPTAVLLRTRLEALGWSQADVARELGVSAPTVGRWLEGTRSPSLKWAFKIEKSELAIPAEAWINHGPDESGEHAAVDADADLASVAGGG